MRTGRSRAATLVVICIILVFSVIIVDFSNEKWQYIPMLAVMFASPLLLLPKLGRLNFTDCILMMVGALTFMSYFTHPEAFRIGTVAYMMMFFLTYISYTKYVPSAKLALTGWQRFFEVIIKAYAVVLVFQQACALMGLPVFNMPYHNPEKAIGLKQAALSMEPSQSGPIVTVLMYAIIRMEEKRRESGLSLGRIVRKFPFLSFCYAYVCLSTLSVTSLISFAFLLLYFIRKKHFLRYVLAFAALTAVFFAVADAEFIDRVKSISRAVLTLDAQMLYDTDHSASARIAPYLMYIKEFKFGDPSVWLGHGCDYGGIHVFSTLAGMDVEDDGGMGGIMNFIYDYGLVTFAFFMWFVLRMAGVRTFFFWMYVILFSHFSMNMYATWLFFMVEYTVLYFEEALPKPLFKHRK